jgi:hypothetical protein
MIHSTRPGVAYIPNISAYLKVEPFPFHYRYMTVKVIIIGHLLKAMS